MQDKPSLEALACVGNISSAMGPAMEPYVRSLLDVMFAAGLSPTLVEALEKITDSIPSLLPTIQDRLLNCISSVLSKSQYSPAIPVAPVVRGGTMSAPQQVSDLTGSTLVQLALQTLARFNFKGHELLEFARESVVIYLDDEDGTTRKDAALCCCKLVANSFSSVASAQFSSRPTQTGEECSNNSCRAAYHPFCAHAAGLCIELEVGDRLHLLSVDDDDDQ